MVLLSNSGFFPFCSATSNATRNLDNVNQVAENEKPTAYLDTMLYAATVAVISTISCSLKPALFSSSKRGWGTSTCLVIASAYRNAAHCLSFKPPFETGCSSLTALKLASFTPDASSRMGQCAFHLEASSIWNSSFGSALTYSNQASLIRAGLRIAISRISSGRLFRVLTAPRREFLGSVRHDSYNCEQDLIVPAYTIELA